LLYSFCIYFPHYNILNPTIKAPKFHNCHKHFRYHLRRSELLCLERETALNMFFHEGKSYKTIAKITGVPLDTVKSWCRRYRLKNDIPQRGEAQLSKDPLKKETIRVITPRDETTAEARIAQLEMEVELLRNFLILTEEK
jgi:transposase-like protein